MRYGIICLLALCFGVLNSCFARKENDFWKSAVRHQIKQLGYRNWIVVTEASYPAYSRHGIRYINANVEIDDAVRFVIDELEGNQFVQPKVYFTRELRSVENDYAPGIELMREKLKKIFIGHEITELEQESLSTMIKSPNQNYDVLVIRTPTALPYASVFIELLPGYWDNQAEDRLRLRILQEGAERLVQP